MKLGDRIKERRLFSGLSQQQLAHAAGISRVTLGFYERNKYVPPTSTLFPIASALGVSVAYLLHGEDEENKSPTVYISDEKAEKIQRLVDKKGIRRRLDNRADVLNLTGLDILAGVAVSLALVPALREDCNPTVPDASAHTD